MSRILSLFAAPPARVGKDVDERGWLVEDQGWLVTSAMVNSATPEAKAAMMTNVLRRLFPSND